MRIAAGVDAELAVPAFTAKLAILTGGAGHETQPAADATHAIVLDEMDAEAPQEFLRLFEMRRVLREQDDPGRQADSASHEMADARNRPVEAAALAGDLVVDGGIERVEREVNHHAESFERLDEILAKDGGVGEDF